MAFDRKLTVTCLDANGAVEHHQGHFSARMEDLFRLAPAKNMDGKIEEAPARLVDAD